MTWYAEKSVSDGRWRVKSDDDLIATVHGDNAEADAKLIALVSDMVKALQEITKGEGRYSRDPLEHASNTIEDMRAIAIDVLARVGGR
jgi:hypothetical protein